MYCISPKFVKVRYPSSFRPARRRKRKKKRRRRRRRRRRKGEYCTISILV